MSSARSMYRLLFAALALSCLLSSTPIEAQSAASITRDVRLEQHVGNSVPLDLLFNDEDGRPVRLAQYMSDKPAILLLVYYTCPNLCPTLLRHVTQELNGIALDGGRDFNVVVVSIDPLDTPAVARAQMVQYVRAYRRRPAEHSGWHFLTGSQASIDRLSEAVGYHAIAYPERKTFAHVAASMILSPGGRLSHYFFGVDVSPADMEAALRDASALRATRVDDADQQYCFDYDPRAIRSSRIIAASLQVASALWVLLIASYIGGKIAREIRRKKEGTR